MRLGIVSDTHGRVDKAMDAARMLESLDVERVIHCGDIGDPAIIEKFARWPAHYVFGNCDYDTNALIEAIADVDNAVCHDRYGELTLDGVKIAIVHSDDATRFREALRSGAYDLVCYGHTHVAAIDRHGKTLSINPGAIHRANPPSIAVVDLPNLEATIVPLA